MSGTEWMIEEQKSGRKTAGKYETVFALGNGYRSLRGQTPFAPPYIPGNFIAGIFDKSEAQVTELVNLADPLPMDFYVDYEKVGCEGAGCSRSSRRLDMEKGLLITEIDYATANGSAVSISGERFVSRANVHKWAEKWTCTAMNFSHRILVSIAIDGSTVSSKYNPIEAARHFDVGNTASHELIAGVSAVSMNVKTFEKGLWVTEAVCLASASGSLALRMIRLRQGKEKIEAVFELNLDEGLPVVFYRYGTTWSGRDRVTVGSGEIEVSAQTLQGLKEFVLYGYEKSKADHEAVLRRFWDSSDIVIEGDERAQRGLRFNIFQLYSCASADDDTVSIGAKGLHGEGYRGHVFWDTETFMLPFFIFTQPKIARNLLSYRYNTIAGARENARKGGGRGSRFAWESADEGTETTPRWGVDYGGNRVRIWTGDIEVHINADITYAILKYLQITGDVEFLEKRGFPILLETALFWADFVLLNEKEDRYEIRDVIGPDEFHEHVDNNTFTNYLVKWSLRKTLEYILLYRKTNPGLIDSVLRDAGITEGDLEKFALIERKMYIPVEKNSEIIEQFEGYSHLQDILVSAHDKNGMPLWPKGVDVTKLGETTLVKQADVVMLFGMLGEEFSQDIKLKNYDYYEKRTMHKSSLSPSMYAMIGLSINRTSHAYDYFIKAIETDLCDNQGNTDGGLHAASAGGSWQVAVYGFGGLTVDRENLVHISPWLPSLWKSLSYSFVWRGMTIHVRAVSDGVYARCTCPGSEENDLSVRVFVYSSETILSATELFISKSIC